jgi:hypothetical protein
MLPPGDRNWQLTDPNYDKSAASFCPALFSDMFCSFYLVKYHKIANNSTMTKATEKMSTYLEFLEFYKFFDACLT